MICVALCVCSVYRGRGAATGSTKGEERTILYAAMSDVTEVSSPVTHIPTFTLSALKLDLLWVC